MKRFYACILCMVIVLLAQKGYGQQFITTWSTSGTEITIPTNSGSFTYNYNVTWTNLTTPLAGDGSIAGQTVDYLITGLTPTDTYQIEITGTFPAIYFNNDLVNSPRLLTIEQWGDNTWSSMANAFQGCTNLTFGASIDDPDLSAVADMSFMFAGATSFNEFLDTWDVSNVTNMSSMFEGASSFNGDIRNWSPDAAIDMSNMFKDAISFNVSIDDWDVTGLQNMNGLFYGATSYTRDVSNLDVSSVTDMTNLFRNTPFNNVLEDWDVSSVVSMAGMFQGATFFNQDISTGTGWDVSGVSDMSGMFDGATSFNQDIGNWDITSVSNMNSMFNNASLFDQNLGLWDITLGPTMANMLDGSGLSADNYDATLIGWDALTTTPSGITLNAVGLRYCAAVSQRASLVAANSWSISGDALFCYDIASQTPLPNEIGVAANSDIFIVFNDDIGNFSPANFEDAFTVRSQFTGLVDGSLGNDDADLTFDPTNDFLAGDVITVTIGPNFESLQNQFLNKTISYQFRIASSTGPATPDFFTEQAVSTAASSAFNVHVGDVDGDGDLDILSASFVGDKIAWYENDGATNPSFTEQVVSTLANGAASVHVGDVDGDGDLDILSASFTDDKIAWYENDGAVDPSFIERVVSTGANGAQSVFVGDVDGDGDLDILLASSLDDKIAWYENDGVADPTFTERVVSTSANGATSVYVGDVDGDGDLDILSASTFDDKIAWYENDGAADPSFIERVVSTSASDAFSVHVGDVDGDGDLDILSASQTDDKIAWYENDGAVNPSFTEQVVSTLADVAQSVHVSDMDGDGDLDILSASQTDDKIAWYENDGAADPMFTERVVSTIADGAVSVHVGDMDGDGDLDILSASGNDNKIAWYENTSPLISPPPHIYWTENIGSGLGGDDEIHRTDLDGNDFEQFYSGFSAEISGLEIDTVNNRLYWTDAARAEIITGEIGPSGLISGPDVLLDYNPSGTNDMEDLALDVTNGDIYFTHGNAETGALHKIGKVNIDGSNDIELIDLGTTEEPFGIDLDLTNGKIYYTTNFTSTGVQRSLWRADLNGGNVELIYQDFGGAEYFRDVKVDPVNQMVYWSSGTEDTSPGTIFYNDINDAVPFTTPSSFAFSGEPRGIDLDLVNDKIYWVCRGANNGVDPPQIMRANLDGTIIEPVFEVTMFPAGFPPEPPGSAFIALDLRGAVVAPPFNLISTSPQSNATNIATSDNIMLNFDQDVDGASVNPSNILIVGDQTGQIQGAFTGGGTTAITFDPTTDFKAGERIHVTLTSGIMSTGGSALVDHYLDFVTDISPAIETPPLFVESEIYDDFTNTRVYRVAAIDMNLDGNMDVAAIYEGIDEGVAWYQNDGAEMFTRQVVATPSMTFPEELVTGDLDLDGDIDLLGAYNGRLDWYEDDGALGFTTNFIYQVGVGFGVQGIRIVDFDADGDLDIVGAFISSLTHYIRWFENDGNANFTNNILYSSTIDAPSRLEVADLDGDGDADILACWNGDAISWMENDGNQNFTDHPITATTLTSQFSGFAIGDFNGDSNLDMAMNTTTQTSWFQNDGSGNFTENQISTSIGDEDLRAADLDGDGDVDLVGGSNGVLRLYENDGSGNFTIRTTSTTTNIQEVSTVDLDSDGDLDVIVGGQSSRVMWFENTTNTPLPEIDVYEGVNNSGMAITNGQTMPVDFGNAVEPVDITFTFAIDNPSVVDLNVFSITMGGADFVVPTFPTLVAASTTEIFDITLSGSTVGVFSDVVTIASDDPDENPFTFSVSGEITMAPEPEIAVYLGIDNAGAPISDAQPDVIDLGREESGVDVIQIFAIENIGMADLIISDISTQEGSFAISGIPATVGVSTIETFTVTLSGATVGEFLDVLTINNNDSDESSFSFQVAGVIEGANIINGEDNSGSVILSNQNVDIGSTTLDQDIEKTFVIENLSLTTPLVVNSITVDDPVFEVLAFTTTVAPLEFIQFTIVLRASQVGAYSANVSVSTSINDFSFVITGEVIIENDPDLNIFNVVTPNGDGVHDFFKIGSITAYPDNEVIIYNRWGDKVHEISGYDNDQNVFTGVSNVGSGGELDEGNYYYAIDKGNGDKKETGFLFLKR